MSGRVLLVDPNSTARGAAARALTQLGLEVVAFGGLAELVDVDVAASALLILDASREPEAVWARLNAALSSSPRPPLLITAVHPERIPRPRVPTTFGVLGRPFTPRELCAAALDRVPGLSHLPIPFPEPAPDATAASYDSLEVDVEFVLDEHPPDAEELDELSASDALTNDVPHLPELELLPDDVEDLGTMERFAGGESGEEEEEGGVAWESAEDLFDLASSALAPSRASSPPLRSPSGGGAPLLRPSPPTPPPAPAPGPASGGRAWSPHEDATRFAPLTEATRVAPPELLSAGWAPLATVPAPAPLMDELVAVEDSQIVDEIVERPLVSVPPPPSPVPPPAADLSHSGGFNAPSPPSFSGLHRVPARRVLADWAIQLARDWEHIGLESDPERRAELIQTAVIDIEPEAGALSAGIPSPQLPVQALGGPRPGVLDPASLSSLFAGDLALLPPLELLRIVQERSLRGALEIHDEPRAFRLTLWGDTLRYLEPRAPHEELLLGRLLLGRGLIDEVDLHRALNTAGDLPLGERLVGAGVLNDDDLLEVLRLQARAYFYEICELRRGYFVFRDLRSGTLARFGPTEPRPLNFKVSQLVVESLRSEQLDPGDLRRAAPADDTRMVALGAQQRALTPASEQSRSLPRGAQAVAAPGAEDSPEDVDAIVRRLEALGLLDPYGGPGEEG